jgi:hypothetical protein
MPKECEKKNLKDAKVVSLSVHFHEEHLQVGIRQHTSAYVLMNST